jgi:hypothetical integral membrane protein (TIGR02206 family)
MAAAPFDLYGAAHLGALGVTLVIAVLLVKQARRFPLWRERFAKALAVYLLVLYPGHVLVHGISGHLNREIALPCHLCDVAAILGALALFTRRQRLAELVWFWGMAGTLNGLITPALSETFPSFAYFSFFALHSGVVIAAVYLVAAMGLRPEPGAVWRAFGWIQVYLLAAGTANFITGANYGFLRNKPPQASPMDFMGPWPWYILVLEGLALVLFGLLYLPFRKRRNGEIPPSGD